ERNGITGETCERIVQAITSFALYGFPESHAASFALIAYASAYIKCHYLAAFTASILNNQPMGFYQPATLIKDAQRHGLKVKPIDVTRSDWLCTIESCDERDEDLAMRLGLKYVKGLREQSGLAIVRERLIRSFTNIEDLAHRVRELNKEELRRLAKVGALNFIGAPDVTSRQNSESSIGNIAPLAIARAASAGIASTDVASAGVASAGIASTDVASAKVASQSVASEGSRISSSDIRWDN